MQKVTSFLHICIYVKPEAYSVKSIDFRGFSGHMVSAEYPPELYLFYTLIFAIDTVEPIKQWNYRKITVKLNL